MAYISTMKDVHILEINYGNVTSEGVKFLAAAARWQNIMVINLSMKRVFVDMYRIGSKGCKMLTQIQGKTLKKIYLGI
jgi:hypothetical protein